MTFAQQATLINGGDVTVRRDGSILHVSIAGPRAGLAWPATLDDDCRQMKIGQGHLPEVAQFKPETWTRVQP